MRLRAPRFLFLVLVVALWPFGIRAASVKPRVVVLNGDALEVIRALHAMDHVAGISETAASERDFWPELEDVPVVGRWNEPSFERIAELKPDRVLAYRRTPGPELEKTLSRIGVDVIRMDFYLPSAFVPEVRELGRLLGKTTEAERLVAWWEGEIERIRAASARIGSAATPNVLIEGYGRFRTASGGTGIHEMVEMAGGRNLAAALHAPYPEIDPEWVLSTEANVVVKMASVRNAYGAANADRLKSVHSELVARAGWSQLPAVTKGRVHVLAPDIGPGPRALIGILFLAKWFYPKELADLDPNAVHRDYLARFQGKTLRGHFVYPEPH